ncbi:hypothetical protein FAZ69_12905 [Trinickia terrae]|uniref:Uncharacterized protein n=1 Tax=Trinickia terrae TaxID=2571161 RepID=A0A4U1I5P6_9BURK|nr:hypothetical protein [Trinickia terrae]TKC88652.1 hypothetical protein FAZ69_12905 [Trinickia terrae]
MENASFASDYTLVDTTEFALGLRDLEAVADALELLAALMTDQQMMSGDEHLQRVPSALHALGDYLNIRSKHLRAIGAPSETAIAPFNFALASMQESPSA